MPSADPRPVDETLARRVVEGEGVDFSLVDERLRLTPTERLLWHERALELMLEFRRAGAEARTARADAARG
jgi:hypothetical protein